jgi:hypothetical protein
MSTLPSRKTNPLRSRQPGSSGRKSGGEASSIFTPSLSWKLLEHLIDVGLEAQIDTDRRAAPAFEDRRGAIGQVDASRSAG